MTHPMFTEPMPQAGASAARLLITPSALVQLSLDDALQVVTGAGHDTGVAA